MGGILPVQQSTNRSGCEGHCEVRGKPKDQNAQRSADQAHEQDGLPSDPITQPAPEQASCEFGKGEGGSDHTRVERNSALVLRDVEVLDHEVDVGKYSHESNRLTYPADGYGAKSAW